jgi:MoaA/NifB/PqqE/SkfB family radical SAM enzyme
MFANLAKQIFAKLSRKNSGQHEKQVKVCPLALSRIQIFDSGGFVPCCHPYLTKEYFALKGHTDLWNGPQAQALRQSFIDGNPKYCKLDYCGMKLLTIDELQKNAKLLHIHPDNILAMSKGSAQMPQGPAIINIAVDPRCNLACPSCRPEHIHDLGADKLVEINLAKNYLNAIKDSVKVLLLGHDGEVLFSPFLRELLKEATPSRFPQLEYTDLITNGLLYDEKNLQSLLPGSAYIKKIQLSIDAGTKDTYALTRGGDWSRLMRNLAFISEQRKSGQLWNVKLNFVVQRANFESIPDCIKLVHQFGFDRLSLYQIENWKRGKFKDFKSMDVMDPENPDFSKALEIIKLAKKDPKVVSHLKIAKELVS